jgi:23S rRNA (uracil1939-C5)-methyltransferase
MTDRPAQLVTIEKPIYGGSFLARKQGKAVFVPLTLPGEQVRIHITQDNRGYANAEIDEVVEAAPQRIAPACPHFGACGGCNYQHAGYETQLAWKQAVLRETMERAGVSLPQKIAVLNGEPWHYRNRIRLAFDARGKAGYRGRRSHAVVPIGECSIAAPLLVRAAIRLQEELISRTPLLAVNEMALFCNAEETSVLASLQTSGSAKFGDEGLFRALQQALPEMCGLELSVEGRDRKAPRRVAQWGNGSIAYRAGGADYRVDHGAFFQVNRWLVDPLLESVTAEATGHLAWDLFAGVGLFARQLSRRFHRVIAVESAPASSAALRSNLDGTRGEAIHADAQGFLRRNADGERPDLIVVDPPRSGLGTKITMHLVRVAAPSLVYVSCDPATLARDLKSLLAGGYQISALTLADLFPQTFHLETVVHLRRA